jgi:hypothetical protein
MYLYTYIWYSYTDYAILTLKQKVCLNEIALKKRNLFPRKKIAILDKQSDTFVMRVVFATLLQSLGPFHFVTGTGYEASVRQRFSIVGACPFLALFLWCRIPSPT